MGVLLLMCLLDLVCLTIFAFIFPGGNKMPLQLACLPLLIILHGFSLIYWIKNYLNLFQGFLGRNLEIGS